MAARGEEKVFKSSMMGGFRRQDVIGYIESLVREHREEIDAYRSGADLLRVERDEARQELARVKTAEAGAQESVGREEALRHQAAEMAQRWEMERGNAARLEQEAATLRRERRQWEARAAVQNAGPNPAALSALQKRHEEDQERIARMSVEMTRLQAGEKTEQMEKDKRIADLQMRLQTASQASQKQIMERDRVIAELQFRMNERQTVRNAAEEAEKIAKARAGEIEKDARVRAAEFVKSVRVQAARIEEAAQAKASEWEEAAKARAVEIEQTAQLRAEEIEQTARLTAEEIELQARESADEARLTLRRADELSRQRTEAIRVAAARELETVEAGFDRMCEALRAAMEPAETTTPAEDTEEEDAEGAPEPGNIEDPREAEELQTSHETGMPFDIPMPTSVLTVYNPFGESLDVDSAASPSLSDTLTDLPVAEPPGPTEPLLSGAEMPGTQPDIYPAEDGAPEPAETGNPWFVTGYPYYDAPERVAEPESPPPENTGETDAEEPETNLKDLFFF